MIKQMSCGTINPLGTPLAASSRGNEKGCRRIPSGSPESVRFLLSPTQKKLPEPELPAAFFDVENQIATTPVTTMKASITRLNKYTGSREYLR